MRNLLILLILISGNAIAGDLPATIIKDSPAFATMQEASLAGMDVANTEANGIEFGGAVVQLNGKFFYTNPVTIESEHSVNFRVLIPVGAKIVAIYHIHPILKSGLDQSDNAISMVFSEGDIDMAKKLNVPSFILCQVDKSKHEFIPGTSHITHVKDMHDRLTAISGGEKI